MDLRLTEIFFSLQGEARTVGLPTIFIRLTGCPLRCQYCDTAYAFKGGELWSQQRILTHVADYKTPYVTVTGGEPLAQRQGCLALLHALCEAGYDVSIETSGAFDISEIDPRVSRVMDLKTPASGEEARNLWSNIEQLQPHDQVKFVICDQADYQWSREVVQRYGLTERCEVLFSPSHHQLKPAQLAAWVLDDQLAVRMQVQLHKVIWGDEPGR